MSIASKDVSPAVLFLTGATAGAVIAAVASHCLQAAGASSKSEAATPSESKTIYETRRSVSQYLEFHYAPFELIFPHADLAQQLNLRTAFGFPVRIALILEKFRPLRAATAAEPLRALDVGCAVGVSSLVLSRTYNKVLGVDLSKAFIEAAEEMRVNGRATYESMIQGQLFEERTAWMGDVSKTLTAPDAAVAVKDGEAQLGGVRPGAVSFRVADAEALDAAELGGQFDAVLAANLVCRVPHPRRLLQRLAAVTRDGGVLVVLSPFSWWEGATAVDEWIGGTAATGRAEPVFVREMEKLGFTLLDEGAEPFLIPDHVRRFQLGCPLRTVWRKVAVKKE